VHIGVNGLSGDLLALSGRHALRARLAPESAKGDGCGILPV
jgi:hypothetical protein